MEVVPPPGAVARTPRDLRLDEVPGAVVVVHEEWSVDAAVVTVACVTRPVPLWLDELAPAALGGMSGLVRRHLSLAAVRIEPATRAADHWVQVFEGDAPPRAVVGRHELGFADGGHLLACTASCEGPLPPGVCREALAALRMEPGFVVRDATAVESTLAGMLAHPREVVAVAGFGLFALVVVWLARRPRE